MKKLPEQENKLKRAIRDIIALDPLVSTERIANLLFDQGIKTANNRPLDWHYVHKIRAKMHRESLIDLDRTGVKERVQETKERYRLLTSQLTRIAYATEDLQRENSAKPSYRERISAMSAIMKHDLALLNAEIETGVLKKDAKEELHDARSQPLDPESRAAIFSAVKKRFKTNDGDNGNNVR